MKKALLIGFLLLGAVAFGTGMKVQGDRDAEKMHAQKARIEWLEQEKGKLITDLTNCAAMYKGAMDRLAPVQPEGAHGKR